MTEDRTLPPPLPPRLDWFVHTQVGQLAQDGVPQWFHGAISREAAENLLEPQPPGSFLIRVSHSHVGYTLSYRAQNCCRHFMVKLREDGSVVIPGGGVAHASLHALVTFHQQKPMRPHGELLTRPCGQEDPTCVDYEDLFLYNNALVKEIASELTAIESTSPKPGMLHWPEERQASAEMDRAPPGSLASSGPPKAPLSDARQKLWKRLKTLPKAGRRAQQQLKSHLTAVSLPLFSDTSLPVATAAGGLEVAGNGHEEAANQEDHFYREPFEGAHAAPRSPRDRNAFPREALRAGSWSGVSPGGRGLHRTVVTSKSLQVTNQETRGVEEPQDWLPEEYRPPPPFAPGYC
ncbi:hematopoietic SH2 domain-containing protein [Echinops telfairi]|uniref:Hematopoietic SH2 domain-containing protein n=1 Tax=Echinops telfairi TaxID=9371 RepID=A0ABM0J5Z7_ECHTE|nr:hematopoietic SH2 domain-containing protein [Echinops telfairi]